MSYAPDRGHVVWMLFNPQAGHEQGGHRPALVLSPVSYNQRTGLAVVCPITSSVKGYPFEVPVPEQPTMRGVILADQVKSMDWRVRGAEYLGSVPDDTITEVLERIAALLGLPT